MTENQADTIINAMVYFSVGLIVLVCVIYVAKELIRSSKEIREINRKARELDDEP